LDPTKPVNTNPNPMAATTDMPAAPAADMPAQAPVATPEPAPMGVPEPTVPATTPAMPAAEEKPEEGTPVPPTGTIQ